MVEEVPGVEVDGDELGLVVLGLHPDGHTAVRQGRGADLEDLLLDLGELYLIKQKKSQLSRSFLRKI